MKKSKLFFALRILISVSLLGVFFYLFRDQKHVIFQTLRDADPGYIGLSAMVLAVHFTILAWRVQMLLLIDGYRISMTDMLVLNFYGLYFNNFLPTTVGGDVVKACCIDREIKDKHISFSVVLVDRFIGLVTFAAYGVASLFIIGDRILGPRLKYILLSAAGSFVIFVFAVKNETAIAAIKKALNFIRHMPFYEKISLFIKTILSHANDKSRIIQVIAISFLGQAVGFVSIYFLCLALSAEISLLLVLLLLPLIFISSMAPSLNGLGVREGMFIFLFGMFIGKERAFALSLLYLGIYLVSSAVGGVLYLINKKIRITKLT